MDAKKVVLFENPDDQAGFVRRLVVQELARKGYRVVIATARPAQGLPLCVSGEVGQVTAVNCDLTQPAQVEKVLMGAWAVVNLVTLPREKGAQTFERVHVEGTKILAQAALKQGVQRFIQLSDLVDFQTTTSRYALSRKKAEDVLRSLIPIATIARSSFVFGPEDPFVTRLLRSACLFPVVTLVGGTKARYQLLFVGDFARAMAALLERPHAQGQIYELAGPDVFTAEELVRLALRAAGRHALILRMPMMLAKGIAFLSKILPNPTLTTEALRLADMQNAPSHHYPGLADLGIPPTPLARELPALTARFHPHF